MNSRLRHKQQINMNKTSTVDITLNRPSCNYLSAHDSKTLHQGSTHLIGFEFDGTACFRKGARLGPDAIRVASDALEYYSPYLDAELRDYHFYDLGNLNIPPLSDIEQQWTSASDDLIQLLSAVDLKQQQVKLLTLGGEHSIAYAPIKSYLQQFADLVLIHLDAHADLRDGYLGYHYSHASVIRRALDHFGPQHQLIQYGIRSGTQAEYQWMREHQTLQSSRSEFLQTVADIAAQRPIYLTLDLDYFDPAYLPGTGTPEAGGEDFHSFVALCKLLKTKNLVGCDVVELAPSIDGTGNSDVFAAKVVRELLLCLMS